MTIVDWRIALSRKWALLFDSGPHQRLTKIKLIDRVTLTLGVVLDRTADRARLGREPDCLGPSRWLMCETIFEVAVDWEVGRLNDTAAVRDHFSPADIVDCATKHIGEAQARRGERFEIYRRQYPRRAGFSRVGNYERTGPSCRTRNVAAFSS